MADKQVIVEIKYDTEQAEKNLTELTRVVEGEKVAQSKLKKELEDGKISQVEYAKEVQKSKDTQQQANKERNNTIKLLSTEKGSVNNLKAQISDLTSKRDKLNQSTKEGKKQAEIYNKQINELNKSIKNAKIETEKTGGAFAKFGQNLSSIPGPIGGIIKGIGGMTKASLAFIATPIGAVVAALAIALKSVISFLKGSEEGQDRLNKIMSVGSTVIGNLKDIFQDFGKLVLDSILTLGARFEKFFAKMGLGWQKLKGIFKDNTDAIEEQRQKIAEADELLTKRQDERRKSAEELKNGIKGIVSETKKEIETAKQLADRQNALDKLQRDFLVKRAKLESEIADLKTNAIDKENFSARERLNFLQQAIDKENQILATNQKIATEKLAIKAAQNELSNSTKEDLDQQAQLEADLFVVQKDNANKRKELTSQLLAVQNELNAERKKEEELLQTITTNNDIRRGEEIIKLMEHEEAKYEIIAQSEEELRMLREQGYNDAFMSMQEIISATSDFANQRVNILQDAFSKIATINLKEVKSSKDAFLAIGQAARGLTDLIVSGNQAQLDDLQAKKDAELQLAGDNTAAKTNIEKRYNKKLAEVKRAQAKEEKRKAIVDAVIATALGVVKALGAPFPLNLVLPIIIGAAGGVQIATIRRQQEPEFSSDKVFARGGAIVDGKSHSQGGVDVWGDNGQYFGNVQGQEAMFVMNKDATAEIAAMSKINESHGGRSFSSAPVKHAADGGQLEGSNVAKKVQEEIQRTPIFVRVGDIETGMTESANVKNAGVI